MKSASALMALLFLAPAAVLPAASLSDEFDRQALRLSDAVVLWDLAFPFGGVAFKAIGAPHIRRGPESLGLSEVLDQLKAEDSADLAQKLKHGQTLSYAAGAANVTGLVLLLSAFGRAQCCGPTQDASVGVLTAAGATLWLGAPLMDLSAHFGLMAPAVREQRRRLKVRLESGSKVGPGLSADSPPAAAATPSAWEPLWRSAVLPGWGQAYNGRKTKGLILGGLSALFAGYAIEYGSKDPDQLRGYLSLLGVTYAYTLYDAATDLSEFGPYGRRPKGWAGLGPDGAAMAGLTWSWR